MRFFIPSANDTQHAEDAYRTIRNHVAGLNGGVSDRRIYRLKFDHEGNPRTAVVGSDRHVFGNGAVLAIFERLDGGFYVCTQKCGALDAESHPVQTNAVIESEEFSALA